MLVSVFLLSALLPFAWATAVDPNCTMADPTDGSLKIAPSAVGCTDKISASACKQLFGGTAAAVAGAAAETSRVTTCFQVRGPLVVRLSQISTPTAAPSEDVKKAALELCPNWCGFCCASPEYNCLNAMNPRIVCSQVTKDMCESIQWREIIAQDCPSACGFCLLGGCIDAAPDCAKQQTICANPALAPFANANCKRTCNQCDSAGGSSTTMSSIIGGGGCGDTNPNCAQWIRNGFCNSQFYTPTQKAATCGRSCGLCGGK